MRCTPAELDQKERFATVYARATSPAMLAVERKVCGCDYGGNSWLSREQAHGLARLLSLGPGRRLLDLGAGSGWPALYLAKACGCDAVLLDLPENGLRTAGQRAAADGIAGRVCTVLADAAELPFSPGSFDAVSHCDLLCCLVRKRSVLENCRRVIRQDGRMAFTVISLAPGLSPREYRRAIAASPDFVESDGDYGTLLRETGWSLVDRADITPEYEASCRRQIEADRENEDGLVALVGREEFAARMAGWQDKLASIRDGLVLRHLFVAAPRGPGAPPGDRGR